MEYTKGEWTVVEEPRGINQTLRTDIMAFQDGYERNICQLSKRTVEEEDANARLMASSPRLYEELAKLVRKFRVVAEMAGLSEGKIDAELDEAKQALAKAGGER